VITQANNTGLRYGVAGASSVIVLGAILWSKRGTESMAN
jgi:hypothetical protein